MNLLVSTNLDSVTEEKLPARVRRQRVRMLFISSVGLGFRRYYEQLVRYASIDDDVEAVHIEVRQPLAVKLFCATVPVLGRRGWDQKSLRYHLAWKPILRHWFKGPLSLERFDVVHLTHGISYGLIPFAGRGTKFALNIDVTAIQDYRELGYARLGRLPMVQVERQMYEAADLVVCRNNWACRSIIRDFAVPQEKTQLALSSIPLPAKSRADYPPTTGPVKIVFVGQQFERKGGPQLLRLHQEQLSQTAELHICSGGVEPDRSLRNVVWHGNVPNDRLRNELLPTMDLFVFPTQHDMSPWAVIEAASAGLPVVSTRIGAIPDMVDDGKSGCLFETNDWDGIAAAVKMLIGRPEMRYSMGIAARELMRVNYNPDEQFPALLNRLKKLALG
ncbi:MAG TPA: glycosyltransferase family 4 protein [Tepidisphaeraceae bacterium]|jgi:glycosyltransferase involved in cell wall biosynthesis